ncbi:MAG: DivIVA domain-containing protein [Coriobacteriia bacterium]|nr:DivIVA domain-containing protein [Coriobacteriia bacterium]
MAITSNDINNQSFSIDRKGYDVDEVDEFLEFVANEIDALNNAVAERDAQIEELKSGANDQLGDTSGFDAIGETQVLDMTPETDQESEPEAPSADVAEKDARIAELERQLSEKKANDNAIAQALVIAQRTADETLAKANDNADQIIADAREEASRIIAEANADKADIEDEISKLDQDCEEIRGRFQDVLKDFINDATTKLADISDASIMASAHARANKSAARNYETPAAPVRTAAAPAAMDYSTPVFTRPDNATAAPAVPMAFVGERDLSGFGDTVENASDFDDLD